MSIRHVGAYCADGSGHSLWLTPAPVAIAVDDCFDNPCTDNGACSDTGTNSFTCECASGYTFNSTTCMGLANCDTDEANDCDENSVCNHEGPGQHSCTCVSGYSGNGTECSDTDGCAVDEDGWPRESSACFEDVQCFDLSAEEQLASGVMFSCDECPDGFNGNGRACREVDDCADSPCGQFGAAGACTDEGASISAPQGKTAAHQGKTGFLALKSVPFLF